MTTELAHSKLKCGLFGRVISCHDSSAPNFHNSCLKYAPRTRTQAHRRRRVSLASGKRRCCFLDALGRRPVETQKTHHGTCAYLAVASDQEGCRDSISFTLSPNLSSL